MERGNSTMTAREQMARAFAVQARKVGKKSKEETSSKMFEQIKAKKETKKKVTTKCAAKGLIRKKKIKKMMAYFAKA